MNDDWELDEPWRFYYSPLSGARNAHRSDNVTLLTLRCGFRNAAQWLARAIRRIRIGPGPHTAPAVRIVMALARNEIEPHRH